MPKPPGRIKPLRDALTRWSVLLATGGGMLLGQLPQAEAAEVTAGRLLRVGPAQAYRTPSAAAAAARDRDRIEIDAGEYAGDVAVWSANRLTICGVKGMAHLAAGGKSAQQKAVWVIRGNDTTLERIEFSGCRVEDRNGAGIRQEGRGLVVRHCSFHDNENGILTGASPASDILIEYSEFHHNGYGDGYSHNLYIGQVRRFTLQFCSSHHAKTGHLVKSRAQSNLILYNRLMDEQDGSSSYVIDLPPQASHTSTIRGPKNFQKYPWQRSHDSYFRVELSSHFFSIRKATLRHKSPVVDPPLKSPIP